MCFLARNGYTNTSLAYPPQRPCCLPARCAKRIAAVPHVPSPPQQALTPKRRGRKATRASGGLGNRPVFRPSGIAKPVNLSPPSSPSPPRTRKQSLERREASRSDSPPRRPREQRGRGAVPSSPPTKRGGGGCGDYRLPPSPPQRASRQQHGSPPSRAKPQRHPQQRRPGPSRHGLAPERDQERNGGGWNHGRGRKQQQDIGAEGRRIGGDERGGGGRGGGGGWGETYPYGAVYSRSFDTGEFFSRVGNSTPVASPVASPNRSQRRRGESGDGRRDERYCDRKASPRVAETSLRSGGGRCDGGVLRGSASTTIDAAKHHHRCDRTQAEPVPGHAGRWFSSYPDSHAAATPTVASGGEESWGDWGRRVNPVPRRRGSGGGAVAGSSGRRIMTGDSYYGS